MSDLLVGRSAQLDRVLSDLLRQSPEVEAASVVSFDGLPMASALPAAMDENRVAAMSAALLSLGERAAEGLGRGELSQVYVEGESGTVFLVSADDEAVLVAVGARGAKVGLLMYEIRRAASAVGGVLRAEDEQVEPEPQAPATWDLEPISEGTSPSSDGEWSVDAEPVDEDVPSDHDAAIDESDPLGLGSDVFAEHDSGSEEVSSDEASSEEEPAMTSAATSATSSTNQLTPDLGAWASFTPGRSSSRFSDDGWS